MKIAVLGMGKMGQAVATRLLEQGSSVVVWNRSPGKTAEAIARGGREAGSVEEAVDQSEVVISSLSNDEAVSEVAGIVHRCLGSGIYVDASTISPKLGGELSGRFEHFASMPILGNPDAVREGKGVLLAGGPDPVLRSLDPIFEALSDKLFCYPTASQANAAKLSINLLLLDGVVALAESIAVGRAGGLSDDQLRQLLEDSPMVAPGLKNRMQAVLGGGGPAWWTTALGAKDAGLAGELARSAGLALPLTESARQQYQRSADGGLHDHDIADVVELYRKEGR